MNLVSVSSRWWEFPPLLTQQRQQQPQQLWPNRSPPRKRRRRPPDSRLVVCECLILVLLFQIVKLTNGSITQEDANIALSLTTTTMAPNSTSSIGNSSTNSNSHHPHPHPHHHHHSKHSHHPHPHPHSNNLSSISFVSLTTTTTSSLIIKHNNDDDAETLPLLPLPPETPSLISTTFDHTIHVDKNNPKGLKFEEEPSDSYIVRSKSAILRCRTLNALNAWFTCNSGDERRIQSNQKISNYVDPQTGIRLIEIDLEITRSDVEEHQNSGYTNPFQCWCTAYGGHHQIMSRKASVSFAYLKKHFHVEPKSVTVELNSNKPVQFKCVPPFGVPEPVIFWMRNDVIILESEPHDTTSGSSSSPSSSSSVDSGAAMKSSHKPHYFTEKFLRNKKNFPTKKSSKNKTIVSQKKRAAPEPEGELDDEEDDDEDYDEDEELEYDASKQPEKEIGSDDDNDDDDDGGGEDAGDLLLPHHFDLAAEHHPDGKNIPINYHMADDHSLVIKHVTMEDQANYTCGVYNVAGVRFTKPATLTVFVNGEWSNWGSWSPCQLAPGSTTQGMKCGIGTQKRVRHCNNPAPVNNGQFCPGESVQVTECTILCPPIDGFWSPWTQWSTCSHECTQLRRRICNNPVPQYGGTDCFGTDFLVKNCTGGLCRAKIFDSNNNFIQQSIGSASNQNNDQIYFIIIFILILIILTFVIYIVLKFQLHRRRHGAKTFHHTWFSGDSDHLSHGTIDAEDAAASRTLTPTLLLLQQQQDGRFYNKPIKVGSGSVGSAGLISSATPSPHPVNHYPMEPIKTTPNKHLLDKYHLVSRLNAAQGVDQFLLQQQQSQPPSGQSHPPKVPLPTIPRDDDSCSLVSSTGNRYEEPQFRLPPIINTSNSVPNTGSHRPTATNNQTKNGSAAAGPGTNSSSGSAANTASTTANEMSNESEPDYAEPIINQEQNVLNLGANVISGYGPPNTPAPPLPMALPPSTSVVGTPQQQRPISDGSSPRYSSEEFSSGGSSSISSDGVGSLCGRHEKFVKINTDLIHYGHYSSMPNLGVALYLPPGFIHQPINQSLVGGVGDWYIRYGLDTRARFPGICSLSSVITLNMSKHHQVELNRPVILSFRHCLSFNHQQPQLDGSLLKNLVIFWQHNDQLKSSKWIELVHYGDNDDLNCFVHLDSENVYLITRLFGRFMFGFKHDFDSESTDSPLMESIGRQNREASLSKLINFAVTIEQFNSQEHLIKCYVYDNLPASVLMFQNDQLPSSPTQHQLVKVMIGRVAPLPNVYKSTLKLSMPPNRKAALCFEIQTSCRLIKGSKRMEIPLDHLCSMGPNSMLHCSFIVAASNLDDNEEIVDDISNDSNDSESSEEDPSSPTYQNHLKLLRKFRNLDYDIKVWQQKLEIRKRSHHHFHPSDQVTLNRLNMSQLRRLPGNIGHFHQEECIRLFGDAELNLRRILIERLDSGWRQWASTYLAVYPLEVARLLAFLAAQHPSPSYQLMEIWESKTIHEMIVDCGKKKRSNNVHGSNKLFVDSPRRIQQQQQQQTLMSMNPIKMKEIFFARLLHQLKTIRRSDLVELILGHQF